MSLPPDMYLCVGSQPCTRLHITLWRYNLTDEKAGTPLEHPGCFITSDSSHYLLDVHHSLPPSVSYIKSRHQQQPDQD